MTNLCHRGLNGCEGGLAPDEPAAVIGGRIVHEGERINGVHIVSISPHSVEFDKNGKNRIQKPGDEPSKRW